MHLGAEDTDEECPLAPSGYVFYPGKNSDGGDLEQRSGTVEELAVQCNDNVQVGSLCLEGGGGPFGSDCMCIL